MKRLLCHKNNINNFGRTKGNYKILKIRNRKGKMIQFYSGITFNSTDIQQ